MTIAIIAVLAIAFALLWLGVKRQRRTHLDRDQLNIDILRQEFVDLKAQLDEGELNQEQYQQAYDELVVTLGNDLHKEKTGSGKRLQFSQLQTLIGVFVILAVLTPLLYFDLGSPQALQPQPQQQDAQAAHQQAGMTDVGQISAMVKRLRQKLEKDPNNPQGWMMLGRSYMVLKQYDLAADALKHAYAQNSDNPSVLLMYADALAMQNGGTVDDKAFKLIKRVLDKHPENPTAMWMAAMAYETQSDYKSAVSYWKKLLPLVKQNRSDYNEVQMHLAHAEARLSGKPMQIPGTLSEASPEQGQAAATQAGASVTAVIKLDDKYKQKVTPSETVFVYARAVDGPPMPLAVKRLKVSDLPATVTLDDSMAMTQAKLSDFPRVFIGARVSRSGNAMPSSGDLQGRSQDLDTRASKPAQVLINQEVM